MGLFGKKIVKEIEGSAWGHLVHQHGIDVDTLYNEMRCVDRQEVIDGKGKVTLLRIFKPREVAEKQIAVDSWDTFDKYPEFIIFEGYLTPLNEVFLERKRNLA